VEEEHILQAKSHASLRSFDLIAEVGQAVALPGKKEYTV